MWQKKKVPERQENYRPCWRSESRKTSDTLWWKKKRDKGTVKENSEDRSWMWEGGCEIRGVNSQSRMMMMMMRRSRRQRGWRWGLDHYITANIFFWFELPKNGAFIDIQCLRIWPFSTFSCRKKRKNEGFPLFLWSFFLSCRVEKALKQHLDPHRRLKPSNESNTGAHFYIKKLLKAGRGSFTAGFRDTLKLLSKIRPHQTVIISLLNVAGPVCHAFLVIYLCFFKGWF